MKTISNLKNHLMRAAMLLLMVLATTLTASATDFITDVMVAGNSNQSQFNTLIQNLQGQGWTDIDYDLNKGCGSGSAYIHLLYKKQSSSGNTGTPITGFYIRTGANPPDNLTYEGRTYYLVPCDGSSSFVNGHGDLNAGCGSGSAYIFLYYTKDVLSNNTGVTGIIFNTTQSGAVGENGGSTGYDLNTGCGSGSAYIYMHLTTTSGANVVTLCSGSGEVPLLNGHILTGTGGTNTHVTIAHGATVTLNNANITAITNNESHQWAGLTCLGNAVIVLNGNTTNSVKGGFRSSGIYVPHNKTLTLQGSGTLNATGNQYSAGIGGGNESSCGNITISGGTVNATGGESAAGIGSSSSSNSVCGTITISGGTVNATGGNDGAGIGSGEYHSFCGTITISGGTVTANGGGSAAGIGSGYEYSSCSNISISGGSVTVYGGNHAAGIGSGRNHSSCGTVTITNGVTMVNVTKDNSNNTIGAGDDDSTCGTVTIGGVTGSISESPFTTFPYTVAFNANGGTGTMNNQVFMYSFARNLTYNSFSRQNYMFEGWATSPEGPKVYNNGQSVSNLTQNPGETVTLYAKWIWLGTIPGELLLHDGDTLTGIGGPNTHVSIADSATVIFSGVDITSIAFDNNHQWPGITCLGDATIVLAEGTTNSVKGGMNNSGIYVPEGHTLTLQGTGTLNATGGTDAAGIGSGNNSSCGNITISSGTITAIGNGYAAGIGSGNNNSSCGNITISSGNVTASGGEYAAGIGSGWFYSTCGSITISGGTVTASGGEYAAGIGSGYKDSSCGNITISGGTITATGGIGGAGIGSGGTSSACGSITLSGGTITATGGIGGAGIGSGENYSSCGSITLSGGTVTATGGQYAAGIGSGNSHSSCGNITITNGVNRVTATKGANCDVTIGHGITSTCGTFTIGGAVTGFITQSPFVILTKRITGYGTSNGGWQLIASPIADNANVGNVIGLISSTTEYYDLYRFNQAAELEWENWKAEGTDNYHFNLESGRGYLYANNADDTLMFRGAPYTGDGKVILSKTTGEDIGFPGWNLIGNPFGTAATINKAFYRMNPETNADIIAADNNTVEAMEGIFVVAETDGETVTFTEATRATENGKERIVIGLCKGGVSTDSTSAIIDRAIICFDEGEALPKFQLHENSTKISIPQNGKEYAIVNAKGMEEIPISIKPAENGTYTLTVSETFHSPLSTFHLLDILTGTEIDLLANPSYTFTATTHDDASRFKLVFKL